MILQSNYRVVDRVGLWCAGLLLLSPLFFKVRVWNDVTIHPLSPLLLVAWCWTVAIGWPMLRANPISAYRNWIIAIGPVLCLGLLLVVQGLSLIANQFLVGGVDRSAWLLLAKGSLYLTPLPFGVVLAQRAGFRMMRLVSILIPPVALLTLVYSFTRLIQHSAALQASQMAHTADPYYLMGMLGEVLTPDGLVVRWDTVSQGAYGMYLALVATFSFSLALFNGWNVGLPAWYARGQAFVVFPAALVGITFTGSRTSLFLLCGIILTGVFFFLSSRWRALFSKHSFPWAIVLIGIAAVCVIHYTVASAPALERTQQTAQSRFELTRSAGGSVTPFTQDGRERGAEVWNVEARVWLWGITVRYLKDHPSLLLTGLGNDRKRFLREVIGLPYEGRLIHFHTAHNLFLDMLIKNGVGGIILVGLAYVGLLLIAVRAVTSSYEDQHRMARTGLGFLLLTFWIPFLFVNLVGEELFTDNLELHWTLLFGLLLGLMPVQSLAQKSPIGLRRADARHPICSETMDISG